MLAHTEANAGPHLAVAALQEAHELPQQRLVVPPGQAARQRAQGANCGVRHVGLPVAVLLLALVPRAAVPGRACRNPSPLH